MVSKIEIGRRVPGAPDERFAALSIRPLAGPPGARIAGAGLHVAQVLELLNGVGRSQVYEAMLNVIRQITGFETTSEQLTA